MCVVITGNNLSKYIHALTGPVGTMNGPRMNGPRMNGVLRSNSGLSQASTVTASQRSVTFVPPGEPQSGKFRECSLFGKVDQLLLSFR